jgi:putative PIN family toxin of toxin-antitoxin system
MKIVIDTNVMVSSFWGGNPKRIIDMWSEGRVTLCLSQAIFEEYVRVISKLGLDGENELFNVLKLLREGRNIEFSIGEMKNRFIKDDPDDDKFVNCAIEHDCKVIVSGDKHLLKAGKIFDIQILNPKDFLDLQE